MDQRRTPGERALDLLGHPTANAPVPASPLAFPDGGTWRTELPSCEGPAVLEAVLAESARLAVPLHRVSQGSGVWMLTDAEIAEMVAACAAAGAELCLFLGPRGSWGPAPVAAAGVRARGRDQVAGCLDDALRAAALGVRCLLVADEGVLWALHRLRAAGELPADTTFKVSALVGPVNPMTYAVWERLGADSINVPGDLTLPELADLRAASAAPMDFYVEAPGAVGGQVRLPEAAEVVRCAAPVYLKFGLRNAPDVYPAGAHLREAAVSTGRERVRRGRLVLDALARRGADGGMSPPGARLPGKLLRFAGTEG
ncbi:hypothetical protein Misp01_81560 [Microtetraspora sp. NBRC 13810]|uniref:hypothetical protein n=1 Tax=Microtetraspora sp. NBRC 13810 TaxID=3030990 RepID=UPI0024A470FC|nr:hypothetical protein [Microtetraspora sp. NBRC 13810]GLW13028.1 hypothetical protein Misp01_81560 [Microtetraspora sp. NBRC 13810]